MKKHFKILVLMFIILVILGYCHISSSINYLYKENWNLNIPNPIHQEELIDSVIGDGVIFEIYYYTKEDVETIKKNKSFKQIEVSSINEIYENNVETVFINYLSPNEKELFYSKFDCSKLFNETNYYTFITENNNSSFLLLVLDTENKMLYSISVI